MSRRDSVDATAPRYGRYAFHGADARSDLRVAAAPAARGVPGGR